MKTIQMIIGGKWINLTDHGCVTDKDFINYVSLGPLVMRIADDSTHGATVYQEDILETQMLVAQSALFEDEDELYDRLEQKTYFEEVPCKGCWKSLLLVPNPLYGGLCFGCNEDKTL